MAPPARSFSLFLVLLAVSTSCHRALAYGNSQTQMALAMAAADIDSSGGLPEGATCYLNAFLQPKGAPCASSPFHCFVTRAPSRMRPLYLGVCNSSYAEGPHCIYTSQPYAVGTRGIRANPACPRCTCANHPENAAQVAATAAAAADYVAALTRYSLAGGKGAAAVASRIGANTAQCDCPQRGPCYVNWKGDVVSGPGGGGAMCEGRGSRCVIRRVGGGGRDAAGRPLDKGVCEWEQREVCVAAGDAWGPKFYSEGVRGVPAPNAPCQSCVCGMKGRLQQCERRPGCDNRAD